MLVLSRKKNESIVIDENIIITVVEIRGDKVRLGIQAPREVPIHRQEIFESLIKRGHLEEMAPPQEKTEQKTPDSDIDAPIENESTT